MKRNWKICQLPMKNNYGKRHLKKQTINEIITKLIKNWLPSMNFSTHCYYCCNKSHVMIIFIDVKFIEIINYYSLLYGACSIETRNVAKSRFWVNDVYICNLSQRTFLTLILYNEISNTLGFKNNKIFLKFWICFKRNK